LAVQICRTYRANARILHIQFKTLHYTTLHYTTLHYTTLHYTTLHYTTLHYTTLHYTALHRTAPHRTAIQYNTIQYNTIQYNTIQYKKNPSSDTQGWFGSLHRPLGQLARKALNLLPKIDTKRYNVRCNQISALISKLFSLVILLIGKWWCNQLNYSIHSAVHRRKFN